MKLLIAALIAVSTISLHASEPMPDAPTPTVRYQVADLRSAMPTVHSTKASIADIDPAIWIAQHGHRKMGRVAGIMMRIDWNISLK